MFARGLFIVDGNSKREDMRKMTLKVADEFLVLDSRLYSDLDKYIWINDSFKVHREAQRFFVCLMKKGIYVKGFATDKKQMFGLKMYNKKIYDINTLDRNNSIVFYDTYLGRFDVELPENVHNARLLNPNMPKENIVIWGSGITGRRVHKILSQNGVEAECYIDSNESLEGTYMCGLSVYSPGYLKELAQFSVIVEAMEKWEELDRCIREVFENRYRFSFVENNAKEFIYRGRYMARMFDLMSWHGNFGFLLKKKVYIYGIGEVESELAKYLSMLDIEFGGFLKDESDESVRICDNCDLRYVEEILYEKDYFIWTFDKKKVKRLEELGFVSHENYIYYDGADNTTVKKKHMLDTNLGHNYLADSKYPGIMVYGEEKEKDFKIAVLGGSTTDGRLNSYKSWPELMFKELYNQGLENITVYNGGVSGYASGQELLKLIRDMVPLNPNMIIVYDGLNDLNMCFQYPLTNGYLKKVFEFASENMENDEDDSLYAGKNALICQGIEMKKDMFDAWLSNVRTMYAIAAERNISFYSFCQPMLGSKKGKTEGEKSMLLSVHNPVITNLMEGSFRRRISQMGKLPEYMYDLSHILDNEKDVYKDHVHLWEKGNQIIAREITRTILPKLGGVL